MGGPPDSRRSRVRGDPDGAQGPLSRSWRARLAALAALAMLASGVGHAAAEEGATLAALERAYGRELNARAHYLAFASGAEREGRCGIACLFRVAARAESIHARRFAPTIEQLGGRLEWSLEPVVVRGTAENLRNSIDLERWEGERVYPRFADYARDECLYEALAMLNYARFAEATHAAMFAAALEHLEQASPGPLMAHASVGHGASAIPPGECATTHYLCTGDGSIFSSPLTRSCPNCGTRGSRVLALGCQGRGRWVQAEAASPVIAAR